MKKWVVYVAVAALALIFMIISPLLIRVETFKPTLSYEVGGCLSKSVGEIKRGQELESDVEVSVGDSSIKLLHHLRYVCCADIVVEIKSVEKEGDYTVIKILEKNVGEMCRCICEYEITMKISGLKPGKYKLEIYGVEYEDMPVEKLWEGEVRI